MFAPFRLFNRFSCVSLTTVSCRRQTRCFNKEQAWALQCALYSSIHFAPICMMARLNASLARHTVRNQKFSSHADELPQIIHLVCLRPRRRELAGHGLIFLKIIQRFSTRSLRRQKSSGTVLLQSDVRAMASARVTHLRFCVQSSRW